MKKLILLIAYVLCLASCSHDDSTPNSDPDPDPDPNPPQGTLYVSGKDLLLPNGEKIILRGINYPTIDAGRIDNEAQVKLQIDEAAKTGANVIRFPWYTNGVHFWDGNAGGAGTVDSWVANGSLKKMLEYAHQKGMTPILELHDPNLYDGQGNLIEERITCSNNWNYFNTKVANWWKSQVVLNLIEETKGYLIINLANEFGWARYTGNPAPAMQTFKTNYNQLIAQLRTLGVTVPIMIDAPDCGSSSSELLSVAEDMQAADPNKNLIFSTHAYWHAYAETQAEINQKLDEASSKNVCFVIGEVANTQDVNGCGSQNILSIAQNVLEKACANKIGWMAWTFDQDCSGPREMTPDGNFNNLTAWGDLLVNNPAYGLKSVGGCGAE